MSEQSEGSEQAGAPRSSWGSKIGFILAAGGSAVGLGNLWKFPYLAYSNGGGATDQRGAGGFVLIYLLAVLVIGLPIMIAEMMVGRRSSKTPIGAFRTLRPKTPWKYVGVLGVVTGFLLLSYYNVITGWTVEYTLKSLTSEFSSAEVGISEEQVKDKLWHDFAYSDEGEASITAVLGEKPASISEALSDPRLDELHQKAADTAFHKLSSSKEGQARISEIKQELYPQQLFSEFIAHPYKQLIWALVFMVLTVTVVIGGVSKGIERWSKILMPALFLLLLILVGRMLCLDGAGQALSFLFHPSFEGITMGTVLNAMGQAFFSLSLGMGVLITYGSYLKSKDNLVTSAYSVVIMDTVIALIASVIIFSAIFSYGLVMKDGGTGNLFTAIPVIFMKLPGGTLLCALFYLLVMFAALTSTISMLEAVVACCMDELHWTRRKSVLIVSIATFIIGIPSAFSYNLLSKVTFFGRTWLDFLDMICSNYLLPLGGLLTALFVGFVLTKKEQQEELPKEHCRFLPFSLFRVLIRYVAPLAVIAVLVGIFIGTIQ